MIFFGARTGFLLFGIYVDVVMNSWHGAFWNLFQAQDQSKFLPLMIDYLAIASFAVLTDVYDGYVSAMWQVHMRDHLTRHYRNLWVASAALLRSQAAVIDNPDQRIEEDIAAFCERGRGLLFGALSAAGRFCVFAPLMFTVGPPQLSCLVIVWSVGGALTAHFLGSNLRALGAASQRANADFRSDLIYARDHAENLALAGAENVTQDSMQTRFEIIKRVQYGLMDVTKHLKLFTGYYENLTDMAPFIILAPSFFNGTITLGTMFQLKGIVDQVSGALSFPISVYGTLVDWRAVTDRLMALEDAVLAARRGGAPTEGPALAVAGLRVEDPAGRVVVEGPALAVAGLRVP